ncbi:MAG: hypothetical protein AAGD25_06115 [Cyanobacteria bacterium P01_F01_bin.150]
MNTDNLAQMMQKGFHVTLGAASFLVDTAITPNQEQRDANLSKLQSGNFESLTEEWAVTGEQKEQEAKTFVESVITKDGSFPDIPFPGFSNSSSSSTSTTVANGPSVPTDIQDDLEALTTELSEIRAALRND